MKCFNLLWRGSRDEFTAEAFHRRCNRHANTLTLILDSGGNVFGGFTPVEWESRRTAFRHNKGDDSLRTAGLEVRHRIGEINLRTEDRPSDEISSWKTGRFSELRKEDIIK
jgi:hypothetical protein